MKRWDRIRIYVNQEDYRPVLWPPAGPYWCSGESETHSIVVAYVPQGYSDDEIRKYWPEVTEVDRMNENVPLTFSDRFSEPEWWKDVEKTKQS